MKNQYFGDVNDYLKYGLLRCFSEAGLRVGVCWMLTPDDGQSDGRKTRYLSEVARWRKHDPTLFDVLRTAVEERQVRDISIIEADGVIPNATFFDEMVPDGRQQRTTWFQRSLDALSSTDLLFFDPDNGIEIKSKRFGSRGSNKYVFWSEVKLAWERGVSVLLFQHFRREKRDVTIGRSVVRIREELSGGTTGAASALLVIPDGKEREQALRLLDDLERAVNVLQDLEITDAQEEIIEHLVHPRIKELRQLFGTASASRPQVVEERKRSMIGVSSLVASAQALALTTTTIAKADEAAENIKGAADGLSPLLDVLKGLL